MIKRRIELLIIVASLMIALTGCQSGWTPKAAVASCQAKRANQSNIGISASEYDALLAIDEAVETSITPVEKYGVWPCRYMPSPCSYSSLDFSYASCSGGHVVELAVRQQGISQVPPEIAQLTELEILNLVRNQLTELSIEVSDLRNLQVLYLRDNQLADLPTELGQLSGLTHLDLAENYLTRLPSAVVEMSSLQVLYLTSNELVELPVEISQLAKLQYLDVTGNPITELPPEICAMPGLTIEPAELCEGQ